MGLTCSLDVAATLTNETAIATPQPASPLLPDDGPNNLFIVHGKGCHSPETARIPSPLMQTSLLLTIQSTAGGEKGEDVCWQNGAAIRRREPGLRGDRRTANSCCAPESLVNDLLFASSH